MTIIIKPIPEVLLVDTAIYQAEQSTDHWGKKLGQPVSLDKVLVQPESAIKHHQHNESRSYKHLLFFDVVHSRPLGQVFVEGDTITYEGVDYVIAKVEVIKAFDKIPHHWEVWLS